jgi:hypothetical protein
MPPYAELLKIFCEHHVQFILVGGVAAVAHGAPVMTFDLDLVHARSEDNIQNMLPALSLLDAHYRMHPKKIVPNASHLASLGHQLLQTRFGPLDLLGSIDGGRSYADLLPFAQRVQAWGIEFLVLSLAELIEVKERAGRPKDLAVMGVLRQTLALRREDGRS